MTKTLFLTYDGLTSQIGQSQVLPYIIGLGKRGYDIHVVSFETPEGVFCAGETVAHALSEARISWTKCRFRSKPPLISKVLDQMEARRVCRKLVQSGNFSAIHCRSYFAADVGMRLKEAHGLKVIFDMRGFWVDQRLEGGRWPQEHPFYRWLYKRWKRKESLFVAESDEIVVLTNAAREEVKTWNSYCNTPISVIPCSLDYERFLMSDSQASVKARRALGIPRDAFVLTYLGSLGTVYLFEEMINFFWQIVKIKRGARFLFVGNHDRESVLDRAKRVQPSITDDQIICISAAHSDVPFLLGAANAGVCFITPTYSSLGVSPTKLGEYLAVGLPVVCNDGVGDVVEIVSEFDAGIIIQSDFHSAALEEAAVKIVESNWPRKDKIRMLAKEQFDISLALEKYAAIYSRAIG